MKNLISRVEALKQLLTPVSIPWGQCYDAIREMNLCTSPGPPEWTPEQWEAEFIEKEGTREDFIKKKTEQWQRQHRRGGN